MTRIVFSAIDWPQLRSQISSSLRRFNLSMAVREEIVQESILRFLDQPDVRTPHAWMICVARHLALDGLRRQREVPLLDHDGGCSTWERRVDARLDAARVIQTMNRAPSAYRELIQRHYLQDISVDELVADEPGDVAHARDRVYKRRARGLAWARTHVESVSRSTPHGSTRRARC